MSLRMSSVFISLGALMALMGCQAPETDPSQTGSSEKAPKMVIEEILALSHPDLVSAGLGLEGLKAPRPSPEDLNSPTIDELRRIAFHTHFNGLSALNTPTGLGAFASAGLPEVAGMEISTWRPVADSHHQARALLQIPDNFDATEPCLVVAPASGSRGIYGAVPLVAPWALPKGCAVVYSDKGAGSDYFDLRTQTGVTLIGERRPVSADEWSGEHLGFVPDGVADHADTDQVAVAHPHSQAHVEADWGWITLDAAQWAIEQLVAEQAIDDPETLTVIATGLSNGGQAVLRALEADRTGILDAVVAIMPNITPPGAPHLYEYAAMAALYQPCWLGNAETAATLPFTNPLLIGFGPIRCQSLVNLGLLDEASPQAAEARLRAFGFDDDGLTFAASTVVLDIWRTVLVNYASAYQRASFDHMPCGYAFDASQATEAQKALWWATGSGSPPGDGIQLVDTQAALNPADPHVAGLKCLADLAEDETIHAAIEQTRASARWDHKVPVIIVHGQHDGLIPAQFSSRPYVEAARAQGMVIDYREVEGAQHFDAFLNALVADPRWVPILPEAWDALDRAWEALHSAQDAVDQ